MKSNLVCRIQHIAANNWHAKSYLYWNYIIVLIFASVRKDEKGKNKEYFLNVNWGFFCLFIFFKNRKLSLVILYFYSTLMMWKRRCVKTTSFVFWNYFFFFWSSVLCVLWIYWFRTAKMKLNYGSVMMYGVHSLMYKHTSSSNGSVMGK